MLLKTVKDYYESVAEKFPGLPMRDLKNILNYGWKLFYLLNSYGGDILLCDSKYWLYSGYLTTNSKIHFIKYIRKLSTRLRVLYKRKKIKWDGYYYFALSDTQYLKYLDLLKKRGRPKKHFTFYGYVVLYKIKDECYIKQFNDKHLFRVKMPCGIRLTKFVHDFKTDKAEYLESIPVRKFTDILVSNHNYEFL